MGKIMLNSELYGVGVEANPTVPEGTTPTDLTGLKIDKSYFNINSSGGGGGSIDLLWDSGSYVNGAVLGQTYNLSNPLSDYDLCYIVYANYGDRTQGRESSCYTSFPTSDILSEQYKCVIISGFGERHRFIDFTDTSFTVRNAGADYEVYKIIGVKL